MAEFRVALDLQDFRRLVRGEEVQRPITVSLDGLIPFTGVRIILRDIGWPLMLDEIHQAAVEAGRRAAEAEGTTIDG